jgi:hypothetical protein
MLLIESANLMSVDFCLVEQLAVMSSNIAIPRRNVNTLVLRRQQFWGKLLARRCQSVNLG